MEYSLFERLVVRSVLVLMGLSVRARTTDYLFQVIFGLLIVCVLRVVCVCILGIVLLCG